MQLAVLLKVLVGQGWLGCAVEYSGEGDEGAAHAAYFYKADGQYVAVPNVPEAPVDLELFFMTLADNALEESDLGGYENGEGGEGVVDFNFRTAATTIKHGWYERRIVKDKVRHTNTLKNAELEG